MGVTGFHGLCSGTPTGPSQGNWQLDPRLLTQSFSLFLPMGWQVALPAGGC